MPHRFLHSLSLAALLLLISSGVASAASPASSPATESALQIENLASSNGAYTLKPGPKCEGIVIMGGAEQLEKYPWIDSVTVTKGWEGVEKEDQKFDFSAYDQTLAQVRKFNATHPGAHITMHVRAVGGRYAPKFLESKGVKFYDTKSSVTGPNPIHIPVPYDNPEMLKQTRELYRAFYEHFKDVPEIACFHGTWSGGPWEEIFHPRKGETMPPNYTPQKYIQGMLEQSDVLMDEYCAKGKVGELSFSGLYPSKDEIDITGPIAMHMVQRLGKRSPFLYVNSDGWGYRNGYHVSAGHERDMNDIRGLVNISLQALGDNYGTKPQRQNDWPTLVNIARQYDASYLEIYASDITHLDTAHRIVQGFNQSQEEADLGKPGTVAGFLGFRPWLKQRNLVLYQREGVLAQTFKSPSGQAMFIKSLEIKDNVPLSTVVTCQARTRSGNGEWSGWSPESMVYQLPAGTEVQIQAKLHTDDGYFTPALHSMSPVWSATKPMPIADSAPMAMAKRSKP